MHGHAEVVRILLSAGAGIDENHGRSVIMAIERGHLEVVSMFFAAGMDANAAMEKPVAQVRTGVVNSARHD